MLSRRLLGFSILPFLVVPAITADDASLQRGANDFAASIYQQLARGQENLVFSPFSVFTALSMTLEGARGQTARQIAAALHQPYPNPQYAQSLAALTSELAKTAGGSASTLLNANALWIDRGFRVQADFRKTLETAYGAPPGEVDFSTDTESARRQINSWTGQHTNGKIPELFSSGSLTNETRLVMSTAVYFNGKWQSAFRVAETRPAPFHLPGGASAETKFMNQTGKFGYRETAQMQILEMKYAGGTLAFDIVLPKSADGLPTLEKSLNGAVVAEWLSSLAPRTVEVALPKFRSESEFSLRDVLAQLGMRDAFQRSADFSGIDDRRDLFLSVVRHKAFVDVSEEGTEAAAATGIGVSLVSAVVSPARVSFRADHPFLFFIRDTRTGLLLFAGRLFNPRI